MSDVKNLSPESDELSFLRQEVKHLSRQLDFTNRTLERIKATSTAQANVSNTLRNERLKQDHYMNLILEHSPDILILLDEKARILYCADIFLKRSGVNQFGLIAGSYFTEVFSRFMPEDKLDKLQRSFRQSIETKTPAAMEELLDISGGGEYRNYDIFLTALFDDHGVLEGSLIIFHDMTDIQNAVTRAEEASKAKTNFLANMSHEIRTPLNAIIGMANIGYPAPDIDKKNYCFEKIKGASTHLLGVINDILDMSKIEADKFELSLSGFEFARMIDRIVDVFGFKVEEKQQKLEVTIDPEIPQYLFGDEQRLAQVITNLISNAVKFTPPNGTITLEAKRLPAEDDICTVEITVTDTGIGMTKGQQAKLFHPFEQADNSISRKYGGTGLGLAISKRIVELMDGNIRVESESGKGSSFIVTIKAKLGSGIPAQEGEKPAAEADDSGMDLSDDYIEDRFAGYSILLAEDVEINREIVLTVLEPLGVTIDEAENGRIAFEKFAADPGKYDVILMDVQMPNMGGYETTRLIRAMDIVKAKEIPIIAMTANVFSEDIAQCLAAGMNDHIGKPLDFDELFRVLGNYLPPKP